MIHNKEFPNFLIVGAAKAATTTIHEYLKQHPNIFMCEPKEPSFYTFAEKENIKYSTGRPVKFVTRTEEYHNLFLNSHGSKIRGESSTPYLFFYEETINNIKKLNPDSKNIKILIILRNPVRRAYSQYMMKVRDLVETLSFEEAITLENNRVKENAHFDFFYVKRGLYYQQVKAYLKNFKNVKVMFYDDFKKNPQLFLGDIIDFLNVEKFKFSPISKYNISGESKSHFVTKILKGNSIVKDVVGSFLPMKYSKKISNVVMSYNIKKAPKMNIETELMLKSYYRNDIKNLESLLDVDLSAWH